MAGKGERVVTRCMGVLAERIHRWAIATPARRQRIVDRLQADRPELTEAQARALLDAVGWWIDSARWCAATAASARQRGVEVDAVQVAKGLN